MYAPWELAAGLVGAAAFTSSVPVPSVSHYPVEALCRGSPLPQATGRWGDGDSCLQHSLQPWLTRVSKSQALLSAPQDVRPLNCLQLQTARALSPGFPGTRAQVTSGGQGEYHPALTARS